MPCELPPKRGTLAHGTWAKVATPPRLMGPFRLLFHVHRVPVIELWPCGLVTSESQHHSPEEECSLVQSALSLVPMSLCAIPRTFVLFVDLMSRGRDLLLASAAAEPGSEGRSSRGVQAIAGVCVHFLLDAVPIIDRKIRGIDGSLPSSNALRHNHLDTQLLRRACVPAPRFPRASIYWFVQAVAQNHHLFESIVFGLSCVI